MISRWFFLWALLCFSFLFQRIIGFHFGNFSKCIISVDTRVIVCNSEHIPRVNLKHSHQLQMKSRLSMTTEEMPAVSLRPSTTDRARTITNVCGSGTLCTTSSLPDMQGYPFGSYVDFITNEKGWPVLLLNEQSLHSQNIFSNANVSLFCIIPRTTDTQSSAGLSRVTYMGSVEPVPLADAEVLKLAFSIVHPHTEQLTRSHRFTLHHIRPAKIYLSGGFGTGASWVNIQEYEQSSPDVIAHEVTSVMSRVNSAKQDELRMICRHFLGLRLQEVEEVRLVGVDRLGIDLRVHCGDFCDEYRVGFRSRATNAEDVKSEMLKLFQEAWERDQGLVSGPAVEAEVGDGDPTGYYGESSSSHNDDDLPPVEKYAEDILKS